MSGIAELMKKIGYTVSGSDINESENVKRLKEIGIIVNIGHHKKYIKSKCSCLFICYKTK